jgi:hypothetical protein
VAEKDLVYLKWMSGDGESAAVEKAPHASVKDAQAQAAAEGKTFLGIFDGPGHDAKKIADAKGAFE